MRKTLLRLFCLAVASLCVASALAQSDSTGPEWNQWSRKEKVVYLLGWIDGRQSGAWSAAYELKPDLTIKWHGVTPPDPLKKLFPKVTVGQLEKGLNKFYSDYRNLHIQIRSAVEAILQDITGEQPLTDEYLNRLRKEEAKRQ